MLDLLALEVLDQNRCFVHLVLSARARAVVLDISPHVDLSGVSSET